MQAWIFGAGLCVMVGGGMFAWVAATLRRSGKPWRGAALSAGASILYAGVLLSGRFNPATGLGAALVALVGVIMWVGVIVSRSERRKAEAGHQG